jgi:hypothetical protein
LDQLVSTTPPITRSDDDSIDFRAPDVFSLGLSFRPTAAILIAAEYDFVTYSRLRKEYVTHVADGTSHPDQFFIDDSHEFHVGVDWTLTGMASTPSLRLGLWYDPSHSVRYEPSSAGDSDDLLFSHYLPARDDLTHFTFGAGLPLGQNFEFNAGADISSRTRLFSVSGVVYFK